jgi:hypothetical protein
MTLDSDPLTKNNPAPNGQAKADEGTDDAKNTLLAALSAAGTPPRECEKRITCKIEKGWWDHYKWIFEIAGLVALVVYTIYTAKMYCTFNRQLKTMNDTFGQIQQQTTTMNNTYAQIQAQTALMKKQLEASQGASLDLQLTVDTQEQGRHSGILVEIQNWGHAPATHVKLETTVTRESAPSRAAIGKPATISYASDYIDNAEPRSYPVSNSAGQWFDPTGMNQNWDAIRSVQQVIVIRGTFSYYDGFDTVSTDICRGFVMSKDSNRFQSCKGLDDAIRAALENKQQQHSNSKPQ